MKYPVKTRCMALRVVKYKDNRAIVSCLSREAGLIALSAPDGNGREATRRRALMMPGTVFECVVSLTPGTTVYPYRDLSVCRPFANANPLKQMVAVFISEFLNVVMREAQPDPLLFDYIDAAFAALLEASPDGTANLPIAVLFNLQRFMGIFPDNAAYEPGMVFDMADGVFRHTPPLHRDFLDRDETSSLHRLMRINLRNIHLYKLNRDDRHVVIDYLLRYYELHLGKAGALQSVDVFRQLLD